MTITNSYTRQPTKFDYAEPTKFKVVAPVADVLVPSSCTNNV